MPELKVEVDPGEVGFDAERLARIDGHLNRFVEEANGALRALDDPDALRTEAGRFHAGLLRLESFLDRHLTDEEELVIPVILRDGESFLGH